MAEPKNLGQRLREVGAALSAATDQLTEKLRDLEDALHARGVLPKRVEMASGLMLHWNGSQFYVERKIEMTGKRHRCPRWEATTLTSSSRKLRCDAVKFIPELLR
jgi:hypothetical protein